MRLPRLVRSAGLAATLLATSASAGEGLYLSWGDCPGGGGTSVRGFACDTDAGEQALICSLTMGQPADSVLGVEVVVDLQHSSPSLPDWWQLQTGCRAGALKADQVFGAACSDVWQGQSSGWLLDFTVGVPNQARIRAGFAVPSNEPRVLNATDTYYAARIVISNAGTGACAGCSGAACLVLNTIRVLRPIRPVGSGDVLVETPGAGNGNWAGWQTLSAGSCQAVPVRNRTWGQVKSLYR